MRLMNFGMLPARKQRCSALFSLITLIFYSLFIHDTFAFGQSTLISGYLNTFAVDFANQVLFDGWECAKILPGILASSAIGRHTSVIYLSGEGQRDQWKLSTTVFQWTHPKLRPNGEALPLQCPLCLHNRPWKVPASTPANPVVLKCGTKDCKGTYTIPGLLGYKEIQNDIGTWQRMEVL
jgi:hypothetical protein